MLKEIHDHMVDELQQNTRTDTIFVVTAIVFNLIVLAVNSAVAGEADSPRADPSSDIVLIVFIIMSILVNTIATIALNTGKGARKKIITGLLAMYKDNDVDKYYDPSLMQGYDKRYMLFNAVILCLAVTGIAVPLIIRFI